MVCRFGGSNYRDKLELCLIMELNDSFNFSAVDAWLIIKQHRDNAKNVSEATEVILIIIYSALIFLGVLSNVVVSFVVARRPQMHTARNLYIVNLTVSDLTLCMICMPFTLVHIINRPWTLGVALCKLVPFVQGTNIMVSVGTITVIALDRYFTIVRGQDGPTTRRRVIISIIAVWALSMLTTAPVLFFQVSRSE
ncbi:hypothetical protein GE061_012697 [Apolygus lucorum]|uniref:G-protein coupled receptors family 1 profile domain-containing protein n=1 Tax=Apolygus lucorum TaxID=248454 RepID=A0A8S9XVQ4_APOLU|nr:hypothetical protein GE061_012697 [Apolygus lucorum]